MRGSRVRLPPIAELHRQLRAGEISSRALVESCLEAIAEPTGEGSRTFTRVYADRVRAEADAVDAGMFVGTNAGALRGIPISVKDLFDVAGEPTTAGSLLLANNPPAQVDATVIKRLRKAGAIVIGRTNMTEFAYSGVGLNPHYGTPKNPYQRAVGRIPGGSSSGAAVSVADGMAVVGIGSDTGGSVRIPAALCGLVGFKPTARRVPLEGVLPLSPSLDSIGPIANTVADCALLDAVLAGEAVDPVVEASLSSLRLGVLQGYVLDDLEASVADAFETTLARLQGAGAWLQPVHFRELHRIPSHAHFPAVEAFAWHRDLLERGREQYDPHVAIRILGGKSMLAADYLDLMRVRREIIAAARTAFSGVDALLLPTVPRVAPPIAELEQSDEVYFQVNGAMLRNTSIFNYLDGCALSVPCHREGDAPVGLMIAGLSGWDAQVLRVGKAVEAMLVG